MTIDPVTRGRFYLTAAWLLVLGIITLWFPLSWRISTQESGTRVTQIGIGIFEPLQFTWESSAEWTRFSVSEIRFLWLILTAALTFAAQYLAQRAYRVWRRPAEPSAVPGGGGT